MTAGKKIKLLNQNNEDREWYPTTDEILLAMNKDLHTMFVKDNLADRDGYRKIRMFDRDSNYDRETKKYNYTYSVNSFLDVGTGDGRVFKAVTGKNNDIKIERRYGIEIAQTQADDLINNGVFIIGRDFFKTSLIDKQYGVIFSNPPYSVFEQWANKLLDEANFGVMYLVLPIRWENNVGKHPILKTYDVKNLGEFDFTQADRAARGRVNLIRINPKQRKVEDKYSGSGIHTEYGNDADPDSFERWMETHIGRFTKEETELDEEREIKLKLGTLVDLIENYNYDMASLLDAFKALGKLPYRVIDALGMNRESILEIIRENVKSLKNRYWRFAFDRVSAINSRLTHDTKRTMLNEMEEFNTLDFNEDNLYSIIVWVVKHLNDYTGEQILSVFDKLTNQDYVKAYKSNIHWTEDDWRYGKKPKPEKYKLDYRLVTHCHKSYRYENCIIDDFIVICRSLGYFINENRYLDGKAYGREQKFYTAEGVPAFSVRVYKNHNAHIKVNQELMMKFNIEVAKLCKWINKHQDIHDEFDVSEEEAIRLWKQPGLLKIGERDIKMLVYNEEKCA